MTVFHPVNSNLPADAYAILLDALKRKAEERGLRVVGRRTDKSLTLRFVVSSRLHPDSFSVTEKRTGDDRFIRIAGSDVPCVFAALGRFLTLSRFDCKGGFEPPALPLGHRMRKPVRGIYLASHFFGKFWMLKQNLQVIFYFFTRQINLFPTVIFF